MLDLADGKEVNVNGTKINAKMLGDSLHDIKVEDKKQVKIDSKECNYLVRNICRRMPKENMYL